MTLWIAVAVLTLLTLVPLLLPLLAPPRRTASRLDHDIEVYRDQLREVEADKSRGTVSEAEAAEARREIERRILRAADETPKTAATLPAPAAMTAVVLALLAPATALLLYGYLGSPAQPSQPTVAAARAHPAVAGTPAAGPAGARSGEEAAPTLVDMAARLAERLAAQPDNPQDWALLGRTYWQLEQYGKAAEAFARAVALRGDVAALQSAYGEALTQAADGFVTPPAAAAFARAAAIDPKHPGARFYLALAAQQSGNVQAAYDGWLGLYRDLAADNPGRPAVLERLRLVAGDLGVALPDDLDRPVAAAGPAGPRATGPVAQAPGPTREDIQAAQQMSDGDRQEMIRSMVQRLADRLEETPDDFDGWMRLGRAYGVLSETAKAGEAFGRAAALHPGEPLPLDLQVQALMRDVTPGTAPDGAALEALQRLEALEPENPQVLWFLSIEDARAGRRDAALDRLSRLRGQLPADDPRRAELDKAIEAMKGG